MPESPDRYTHGHHESVLRSHLWRTAENSAAFLLPHLRDSDCLLDVGCGPGTISADLASRLPTGSVTAIDRSSEIIDKAAQAFPSPPHLNLHFQTGDVYALGFNDDSFDVVYAHQVLQHLTDPVAALQEMKRVTSSGGLVAVRDADFGAFAWWPQLPLLDRWRELYGEVTSANGAQAHGGRTLRAWAHEAGFRDVTTSSSTWTYADSESVSWWGDLWAERTTSSDFATQAVDEGLSNEAELHAIADAFRAWSHSPDATFIVVHGEILARC